MARTFYLKYRPQSFSDLDGAEARQEFEKIFSSGKIPHAFLFSGTKGIGKTSAARIVAKAANCEKNQELSIPYRVNKNQAYEPCNECPSCLSITAGTNLDVIEIDAASNRGIDDIKELREKIKLAPTSSKYKVYIIDEVHMLTAEAFNALLKTLEEPPLHVLFILCTTDPEKLPKTIISRCSRINFKKATKKEIVSRLKKIVKAEGLEHDEKALEEIVGLAEGSFRDAVKILEQVSFSGKITLEEVRKTAGIIGSFEVEELLSLLGGGKPGEALVWVDRAAESGVNFKVLIEQLTEKLRQILLANFGIKEGEEEPKMTFSLEETRLLISLFGRAYAELKNAVIPQLPLEMAVVEWSLSCGKCEDGNEKLDEEVRSEKREKPVDQKNQEIAPQNPVSHFSPRTSIELKEVISKWHEILEKVKPLNHSVQAFLRACRPISLENGFLTLEVFYKFHKEQLETEKCRRVFEQAAGGVLGFAVKLKCVLGEKPSAKKQLSGEKISDLSKLDEAGSPNLSDADIIKIAEEIFNVGIN